MVKNHAKWEVKIEGCCQTICINILFCETPNEVPLPFSCIVYRFTACWRSCTLFGCLQPSSPTIVSIFNSQQISLDPNLGNTQDKDANSKIVTLLLLDCLTWISRLGGVSPSKSVGTEILLTFEVTSSFKGRLKTITFSSCPISTISVCTGLISSNGSSSGKRSVVAHLLTSESALEISVEVSTKENVQKQYSTRQGWISGGVHV